MNIAAIEEELNQYFKQECYQEAIAFLRKYLDHQDHENAVLSCYLGLAYFLSGNESEASEIWFMTLLEAENIASELVQILATEAKYRLNKRQFKIAQKLYQEIIELEANNANYYFDLGNSFSQQGLFDEAINSWQEAIKLNPQFIDAYKNLAAVNQKLGDYDQAINAYEKIRTITPNDLDILYNLGISYHENKQIDLACQCWQKCLQINAQFSPAYGNLGYVFLQQGNLEKAINCWQELIKIKSEFAQYYSSWINNLSLKKDLDNDIITKAKLLKSLHQSQFLEEIYFTLGNFLFNLYCYNLAILSYKKVLNYKQKIPEIYYNLTLALIYSNNLDEAEFYLEELAKINQTSSEQLRNILDKKRNKNNRNIHIDSNRNLIKVPEKFYETSLEWSLNSQFKKSNYYPIYPEYILKLKPPNTTDQDIHYSFRFGEKIILPGSFVTVIPQGCFWLKEDQSSSAVITSDNIIIGDLSVESPALSPGHPDKHPRKHSLFSRAYLPQREYIDGTVVVLSGLLNNVYFHWLFDILPRIKLLKCTDLNLDNIDYFLIQNELNFQKETLEILGIPRSKIISWHLGGHIQAKQLIVPSFPGTIAWMPKWTCEFLRENFGDKKYLQKKPNKRIYISRNQSNSRRLINEEEIIDFLSQFDFQVVNLELLSVRKQAALFSQAEVIISPHGSGLSNLVFCQKETKVIEIFSPFYVYPCYWLVSNLVDLKYYYVIGEIMGSGYFHQMLYPDSRNEDIYLNCQSLEAMMKFAQII